MYQTLLSKRKPQGLLHTKSKQPAVTNARFAPLHGLPVAPVSLSTTPVPLRKPRARHELVWSMAASAEGFRLRLGSDVALRLRFARRSSPLSAPLSRSPTADRSRVSRFKITLRTQRIFVALFDGHSLSVEQLAENTRGQARASANVLNSQIGPRPVALTAF